MIAIVVLFLPLAAALVLAILAIIFRFFPDKYPTGRVISVIAVSISIPITIWLWTFKLGEHISLAIIFSVPAALSVVAILLFIRKPVQIKQGFQVISNSDAPR